MIGVLKMNLDYLTGHLMQFQLLRVNTKKTNEYTSPIDSTTEYQIRVHFWKHLQKLKARKQNTVEFIAIRRFTRNMQMQML